MGAGSPYLYSPKNWVTHSPREAQGRWKLRSHPFSPQAMAAPISPQTKHRWKEHSSLAQGQAPGPHGRPLGSRQGAGCGHCWLPARRPAWCTRLVPVPEPLWSCWEQAFVPELVEGLGFLSGGPGGAPSRKRLLAPSSLLLPGPHLLACRLDCPSGVLSEKAVPTLLWKKLAGEKLQSREGRELVTRSARKGPSPAESRRERELTRQYVWAQSPFAALLLPQIAGSASARRHSMHAGGERTNAAGSGHLCGAGEASLRDCPHGPALSLPSWLKGRAGASGEEGGMAGTGAPAGAHSPAWAPLAQERRRDPAPGRLGSSCLPLALLLAAGRLPRRPLCQPRGAAGRDTLLSPCPLESGSCRFMANPVHSDGERLESLRLSSSGWGFSSGRSSAKPEGAAGHSELATQAPEARGSPPPSPAPGKPLPPHLARSH